MPKESRQGLPADGWVKHSTQLPKGVAEELRRLSAEAGPGGSKILATLGMALVVSMKPEHRDHLSRYILQETWKDPDALDPKTVLDGLLTHINRDKNNAEAERQRAARKD